MDKKNYTDSVQINTNYSLQRFVAFFFFLKKKKDLEYKSVLGRLFETLLEASRAPKSGS